MGSHPQNALGIVLTEYGTGEQKKNQKLDQGRRQEQMVPEHHFTQAEGLVVFNHPTGIALPRDEAQSIEFCAYKLFNFHT